MRERFKGIVMTAGKQDVYATSENIRKWADEMNFKLKPGVEMTISDKKGFIEKAYITDKALFLSLGFDKVESIDFSDFEKCTITHDLNDDVPKELHDKYDLICDSGTSEHIFNFPKALENYNKMLKVGGRLIHVLPSSNHVDHGFYMFSPTLFYDYYVANKWNVIESLFIRYSLRHETKLWDIYSYMPGCLDRHSFGGFNRGLYAIFFVVQKTDVSTYNASVQQGNYLKVWNIAQQKSTEKDISLAKRIVRCLPENLKRHLLVIYLKIPLRLCLKLIAKY